MGYYEGLTSGPFKETEAGESVFCPYGNFGRCYLLSATDRKKMQSFLVRLFIGAFLLESIVISRLIDIGKLYVMPIIAIIALTAFYYYYRTMKQLLRDKKTTTMRGPGYIEAWKNMARGFGKGWVIFLLIINIVLTYASVSFLITVDNQTDKLWGIFGIIGFGVGALISIYFLYVLQKERKR